ncbi:MAG TPA: hypothetical protein VF575_01355 [Candidatus Saccharimonadales bacterium]|jgi:hypothetical protein
MFDAVSQLVLRCLRSRKFFYGIVGLLVIQAAWIALTARYPQAFDENYHLGLIELHTRQILPFFTEQPAGPAIYGALERDPSYLYHYIMSFPYRLLTDITSSATAQIIVLRFINIGIFVAALYVYRKLFQELGIGRALTNTVLLFFVLLPVVPLLAAQINYDNFMVYLTGLLFLYIVRLYHQVYGAGQPNRAMPVVVVLQILLVGAIGSIVKFPFAPLFFAAAVIAGFIIFRRWRTLRTADDARASVFAVPPRSDRLKLVLLAAVTVIMLGLCVERYGVNLVQYQAPVPKCDKVLSIDACQAYSPWARDHLFAATYPKPTLQGIAVYPAVWVHRTVYETMFSITSYFEPSGKVTYAPVPPLTIANYTAWTIVCLGALCAARFWRQIWNNAGLRLTLLISVFYLAVLFIQNFAMYLHTGEAVAIHGRYLVPMYPVLLLALAIGISAAFNHYKVAKFKSALVIVTLLLFLQGGGITGWIVRSNPSWYWQQSSVAARANWLAQGTLKRIVHH